MEAVNLLNTKGMKNVLMLIAAAGLIAGCATEEPNVTTYTDQISGLKTDLLENELEAPGNPREVVWLNASRLPKGFKESRYYLDVQYMALNEVGYLEIPPGRTLTLILDGQPMYFEGTGSGAIRKTYKKDFVREMAMYPVTKPQLEKIASAKSVKVRIKGNNGLVEREFSDINRACFGEFVRKVSY